MEDIAVVYCSRCNRRSEAVLNSRKEQEKKVYFNPPKFKIDFSKTERATPKHMGGTDYTFRVTAEECVDLEKIAVDLTDVDYCLQVRTENTDTPKINVLLVHESVINKAKLLTFRHPVNLHCGYGVNYFDLTEITKLDTNSEWDELKLALAWIKKIKNTTYSEMGIPNKINGKPITVAVTNRSKK